MSELVQELEKQLQEAKQSEAWKRLQEQYGEIYSKRLGKAWGSCGLKYSTLNQYKNNTYIQIIYVSDVYIGNSFDGRKKITTLEEFINDGMGSRIYMTGESMSVSKYDKGGVQIHRGELHHYDDFDTFFDIYNHEIDLETYRNLKNLISGSIDNIFTLSYKKPIHIKDTERIDALEVLKTKGCRIVELSEDEAYVLSSEKHPFLYNNHLLVIPLSMEIIDNIMKELKEEDSRDHDYYFYGERIKRTGVYERKIKILEGLLGRI
jgi:hypothetical protein